MHRFVVQAVRAGLFAILSSVVTAAIDKVYALLEIIPLLSQFTAMATAPKDRRSS